MVKTERFGDMIRKHRTEQKLPLRKVASYLDIDQAILSKIERGKRMATREQVLHLARFFKIDKDLLLVSWLSDKIVNELKHESNSLQALQAAEIKIEYKISTKTGQGVIFKKIRNIFIEFPSIDKAWVFGSFARGEDSSDSDIDILIDVPEDTSFTLFDISEIQERLKHTLNRKVDLVMKSALRSYVKKRIRKDLKLIYEKGEILKQGKV